MITSNKNNIKLSDYNYERDLVNRLLMAELTLFDVEVLKEIIDGSLKTTVTRLSKHFDVESKALYPILEKLASVQLLERNGDTIQVNKEMRRYYESQVMKFDEQLHPDLEFLRGLLSKVPIHVLPHWYSIPQSSDNIFQSIVETYFCTPKTYQRYLNELQFIDPILRAIVKEVFAADDFKVNACELLQKYDLSREQFEECMLYLEYNLVCFLGYERMDDKWEEVVTPIHEWRQYLRFMRDSQPQPIRALKSIQRVHSHDFGFVREMVGMLEKSQEEKVSLKAFASSVSFAPRVVDVAANLGLVSVQGHHIEVSSNAEPWMVRPIQEQALEIYKHAIQSIDFEEYSERDVREMQAGLQSVSSLGWVYLSDFVAGLTVPIGNVPSVSLQSKGKQWKYVFPKYAKEEEQFIEKLITGPLFEAGLVAIGEHEEKLCLCVTPFGQQLL